MSDAAFLILFLSITAIMAVVPFALKRIGIPSVISLLFVGMLVGDTGIGFNLIPRISSALSFLNPASRHEEKAVPGKNAALLGNAREKAEEIFREAQRKLDTLRAETVDGLSALPEEKLPDEIASVAAEEAPKADPAPEAFMIFLDKLGALGLMFLMALAGMEADFKLLKSCRRPVALLSAFTFFVPAIAGFLLYRHYFPDSLAGQLLYASLFASHSVGIVFPVMRELKLSKTRFGASVLISTVITDIASIILLAVSVQLFRQNQGAAHMVLTDTLSVFDHTSGLFGNSFVAVFLGIVLLYLGIMICAVNKLARWFVSYVNPKDDLMVTLILLIILVAALVGEIFGINFIIGSFIAGLGLSRVVQEKDHLLFRRFESIGYGFLIPFLFISIGMQTDFRVFAAPGSLSIVLMTVLLLVFSKVASGYAAMKCCSFSGRDGLAAGLMTVPQLSATLTAAAIGKNLGILDPQFFNAIIILSIVTTLPIPSIVRKVVSPKTGSSPSGTLDGFSVPDVVQDSDLL